MSFNRRKFLKSSSAATAGLFFPFGEVAATPDHIATPASAGFQLVMMATNWGYNGTIDAFCAAAKKDGYDGAEVVWPAEEAQQQALFDALKKHSLAVAFLVQSAGATPDANLEHFKKITTAAATNRFQKPLYINCHAGKDHFTFEQNKAFIDHSLQLSKQTGVKLYHETHRSRILFAAHIARQFIEKIPDLKVTLDISHWCNVHESLLADQPETIALAIDRAEHVHARIGHPEGPQVNDPRAPEWADTVKQHFEWWDKIAARKRKNGEAMTVLTEFGPPTYMPTLPYTRQPVVDQWEVNVHMMKTLRNRYQ